MSKPLMVVYNLNSGEAAEKIKAQILSNIPKKMQEQFNDKTALEIIKMQMSQNTGSELSGGSASEGILLTKLMRKINTMPEKHFRASSYRSSKTRIPSSWH